ncbi:hypothetical protein ES703_14668 [subsurface metagenome]
MGKYRKYPNLPWWLVSLDDNTLTPTQKEVLDLDYYCKKHGTKLSHQGAADMLDRSRQRVYESRRRLAELLLRTTLPAKGSFKLGFPIEYQNEAEWLAALRAWAIDPRRLKNKRKSVQKKTPLQGVSSSQVKKEAGEKAPAREFTHPLTPPSRGACGSGWEARRSHPQWKKYLGWAFGKRMPPAHAEFEADYKFARWLKAQESQEKGTCEKTKAKPADTSAP